jgi:hypothetical protein
LVSKKPSSIRLSGGSSEKGSTLSSGLLCIIAAVAGDRMRAVALLADARS